MKDIFGVLILLMICCFEDTHGNKLVTFWGSNGVSTVGGIELGLREYCRRGIYDIIILTTLTSNSKGSNEANLPSLNFANHCGRNPLPEKFNRYLKCPQIEDDIKYCQQKGITILLDIGRSSSWVGFSTQLEAKQFALKIWNLFLGGGTRQNLRTFGNVVLDGINLSLRNSQQDFTKDFVQELRRVMDEKSSSKHFLLTASPNCLITTTHALTPSFDNLVSVFDSLYIDFAASICTLNNEPSFNATLQNWLVYSRKPNGPELYIGIAASDRVPKSNFVPPDVLEKVYQKFSHRYYREIKGIVLDDAGWDDLKLVDGMRYSTKVNTIVKGNPSGTTSKPQPTESLYWQQQQQQQVEVRRGKIFVVIDRNSAYTRKPFHVLCFASLVTLSMTFTLLLL